MFTFTVSGPIERADLPGLSDRVCQLFGSHRGDLAHCDVADVEPDAVTVEALARLQMAARLYGCQVRLCNASDALLEVVALMGLSEVLPATELRREPQRQPEQRKQRLGAQEEG